MNHCGVAPRVNPKIRFENVYDQMKYDIFLEQKIERERNLKISLLKDLYPDKIKVLSGVKKVTTAALMQLQEQYANINNLFMKMSAHSNESLESNMHSDLSTSFFPHVSTI